MAAARSKKIFIPLNEIAAKRAKTNLKLVRPANKKMVHQFKGSRYKKSPVMAARRAEVRSAAAVIATKYRDVTKNATRSQKRHLDVLRDSFAARSQQHIEKISRGGC